MLNIVVLNGGRGAASIIPAMLRHQGLNVTSIVNAYDDGKSTGEIRKFIDMLGPSDIRKVQELMLPENGRHHAASKSGAFDRRQFDEGYAVARRHATAGDRGSLLAHRLNVEKIVWAYRALRVLGR